MNEITQQKINIYEFPNCADEEENKMMRKLKVCLLHHFVAIHSIVVSLFVCLSVCLSVCLLETT